MPQRVLTTSVNTGFVKNISLLSGLSEVEKEELLGHGNVYSYRRKESLFRQGDHVGHFYVICSGMVKLYHKTHDGAEVTTDICIAGDTICTTDIFTSFNTHPTSAVIVHDATIMEFPAEWLVGAAERHSSVSYSLLKTVSRHSRMATVDAANWMAMLPEQRIACFLKKTCVSQGFSPDGFNLPYRKGLIASLIGMRQETLSRALLKLKDIGITIMNKHVALHDLESIDKKVCKQCPGAEGCFARKALMTKPPDE